MAKSSDLAALGLAPALAALLDFTPTAITGTGTSAGTAATCTGTLVNLTTAGSQTGLILPAVGVGLGALGRVIVVGVASATTGIVYPPTGATINGASSLNVAQNKTVAFYYYSPTIIFSILTA